MRQEPIEAGTDQHDDIGFFQHQRACRTRRLRVRVRQQPLGHAHRQIGHAALLHQRPDVVIGLRVGGPLPEDDQRALGFFEHLERPCDRLGGGQLTRRRLDDLDEGLCPRLGLYDLRQDLRREVQIDPAWATRNGGADGARHANADVLGTQDTVGRFTERLRNGELVHLFIVALLQIHDLTLGRAADQDHRKAVGCGVRQGGETVEKTRG